MATNIYWNAHSATTIANTWYAWNTTTTTTVGSYTTLDPWAWNVAPTSDLVLTGWQTYNVQYVETQEAKERRLEQERIRIAQYEEQRARADEELRISRAARLAAETRARELLMDHLDAQQKRDILESGWFDVISNKGRRWRIHTHDLTGNVDLMPEEGKGNVRLAAICGHPPNAFGEVLPNSDHFLAQKLMLEADEEHLAKVSYIHHRAPGVTDAEIRGLQQAM